MLSSNNVPLSTLPTSLSVSEIDEARHNRADESSSQLDEACFSGDLDLFRNAFIDYREYDSESLDGMTDYYMSCAAEKGNVNIIAFLLENGNQIDIGDVAEKAAWGAKESGDIHHMILILDLLFRRGLDLQDCPDILQVSLSFLLVFFHILNYLFVV